MDSQKFGTFISELRKERGWTQLELAQKLNVTDGKYAPSFLPDSGHRKSRIPFQISCLGVPLVGGGIFGYIYINPPP